MRLPGSVVVFKLSGFSWAYFAFVSALAVAALAPPNLNLVAYGVLMVIAFPMSFLALSFSYVSSILLFPPDGVIVTGWVLLIWFAALFVHTVLLELVSLTWRTRRRERLDDAVAPPPRAWGPPHEDDETEQRSRET